MCEAISVLVVIACMGYPVQYFTSCTVLRIQKLSETQQGMEAHTHEEGRYNITVSGSWVSVCMYSVITQFRRPEGH